MTPLDMIDACVEMSNADLGVLAARCPHCQGHFEIQPVTDRIELGYCDGAATVRFEVALSLPVDGLVVERNESPPSLVLRRLDRHWVFQEQTQAS